MKKMKKRQIKKEVKIISLYMEVGRIPPTRYNRCLKYYSPPPPPEMNESQALAWTRASY